MSRVERRLTELSVALPEARKPLGNYVPWTIAGNLVFLAGQVSATADGRKVTGRLGAGVDIDKGREGARLCGLNLLAQLKVACNGNLDRVVRCVRVCGYVNSAADFTDQPAVVNGVSDLIVEVFGDAGKHARTAIGVAALPGAVAVEADAIFEIA